MLLPEATFSKPIAGQLFQVDNQSLMQQNDQGYENSVEMRSWDKYIDDLLSRRTPLGETVFHLAAKHGASSVFKFFLRNSYPLHNINKLLTMQDTSGNTPLHIAAENGYTTIAGSIRSLVNKNDYDKLVTVQNKNKYTPTELAAVNGHVDFVTKLLENENILNGQLNILVKCFQNGSDNKDQRDQGKTTCNKNHQNDLLSQTGACKCHICGIKLSSKNSLKTHIESVHQGLNPYECNKCNKKFFNSSYVKIHIATVHNGLKPHKCKACNKDFASKQSLEAHIESVHKGLKPYECKKCNKKFARKDYVEAHIKSVHNGLKPHKCKVCNKYFSFKQSLKPHIKRAHEE